MPIRIHTEVCPDGEKEGFDWLTPVGFGQLTLSRMWSRSRRSRAMHMGDDGMWWNVTWMMVECDRGEVVSACMRLPMCMCICMNL